MEDADIQDGLADGANMASANDTTTKPQNFTRAEIAQVENNDSTTISTA